MNCSSFSNVLFQILSKPVLPKSETENVNKDNSIRKHFFLKIKFEKKDSGVRFFLFSVSLRSFSSLLILLFCFVLFCSSGSGGHCRDI